MKRWSTVAIVCVVALLGATAAFAINTTLDGALFEPFSLQERIQQHSDDQPNKSSDSSSNKRSERQKSSSSSAQSSSTTKEDASSQEAEADQAAQDAQSAAQTVASEDVTNGPLAPANQNNSSSKKNTQSNNKPQARSYAISYDLGGGTAGSALPQTYTNGQTITLPTDLTREGYTFAGWTPASNKNMSPSTDMKINSAEGNLAFAARWTPIQYNITYNLAGGSISEKQAPDSYTIESSLTIPAPVRARYAFDGWDDGSGKVTSQIVISKGTTGNKSYTAKWRGSSFTPTTQKQPTKADVDAYLEAHPFSANFEDKIEEQPVLDSKGGKANPGKLSQATQDNALRATNFIRFLLGLDPFGLDSREPSETDDVTDASKYGDVQKAQASAVLLAQGLSAGHHALKAKPDYIDKALYNLAVRGTAECNLVAGGNLASKVIGSYMPDPGNLGTGLGHRSWITKPDKKWTGFGLASGPDGTWQTMGATGGAGGSGKNGTPNPTYVAWPNASVPIDCFPSANAESWWSVMHPNGIHFEPANVVITLTDQNGNVITLDKNDNQFGRPKIREYLKAEGGSLIFCPGKEYKAGDVVHVHIDGVVANKDNLACPIDYTVSFTDPVLNKMSYPTSDMSD